MSAEKKFFYICFAGLVYQGKLGASRSAFFQVFVVVGPFCLVPGFPARSLDVFGYLFSYILVVNKGAYSIAAYTNF